MRFGGVVLVSAGQVDVGARRADRGAPADRTLAPQLRRSSPTCARLYIGHCRRHVGDADDAVVDLEAARSGFERVGNTASLIHVCAGLAELYTDRGRSELALGRAAQALRVAAEGKITTYDPWVLCTVARAQCCRRRRRQCAGGDGIALANALGHNWIGEVHRVAVELAATAAQLPRVRGRCTPDRRRRRERGSTRAALSDALRTNSSGAGHRRGGGRPRRRLRATPPSRSDIDGGCSARHDLRAAHGLSASPCSLFALALPVESRLPPLRPTRRWTWRLSVR